MRAGMALANGNNEKTWESGALTPLDVNAPINQDALSLTKGAI